MAYRAIEEGAAGVDMGRNIFQSRRPGRDDPRGQRGACTSRSSRRRRYDQFSSVTDGHDRLEDKEAKR